MGSAVGGVASAQGAHLFFARLIDKADVPCWSVAIRGVEKIPVVRALARRSVSASN